MSDLWAGLILPPGEFVASPDPTPPGPGDDPPADTPPPIDGRAVAVCEICSRETPYSGKGRKPKRCADHKTTRTDAVEGEVMAAPRAAPRSNAKKEARLQTITDDLQRGLGELTGTVAAFAPVTAYTIAAQGPAAMESLVAIAAPYPKFLDGLEAVARSVPWIEVGRFAAALVFALAVDAQRLEPVGFVSDSLGVTDAAEAAGWQPRETRERDAQEAARQGDWRVPKAPSFTLVQ